MPHFQWLLFDADGTLFDYERAEACALAQAFRMVGIPFEPDYLVAYRRINDELWRALECGLIAPEILKVRRFELLFEAVGPLHSSTDFSRIYLECLSECAELIEDAAAVLQALRNKYRMAILTNGLQLVQRGRLERSAIRDCISEIVISEEIGAAKPAKEFFDAAFARLSHPLKEEVVMIGDNWASDIQGGSAYGIATCWFNPTGQARPNGLAPTCEIASLRELQDWLS
jgi:2-haloacid dehalogenase